MTIRHLHLRGAIGTIRTAQYDGREHIVIPVVAMVEGVVWAVNSDVPEFVPAEELAQTPHQWNGRACFAGHPKDNGSQVTANTPETLAKSFGLVFGAANSTRILQTRRLEVEGWLDAAKAETVGPEAVEVVRRARALMDGEENATPIEVSVGAFVEAEDTDGVFGGRTYHGIWRNIVSDHLAFLAEGETGACSVAAGCGAGRSAVRHLVSAEGIRREESVAVPSTAPAKRGLKERFMSLWQTLRTSEGLSDNDVRRAIDKALRAVEPGYMGIDEVYPDSGEVIYYVCPEDEWKMMRRNYTITGDDATLTDNSVEVEPVTTYQPVTEPTTAETKPCSCHNRQASTEQPIISGDAEMNRTERIAALAANTHSVVKSLKALESMTDDELTALENAATVAAAPVAAVVPPVVAPTTAAAAPVVEPKKITRDEIFAADPSIATIVRDHESRAAARKIVLVGQLKVAAAGVFTEEQLNTKAVDELEQLASLAKVEPAVQHVGAPRALSAGAASDYSAPDGYKKQTTA